MREVLFALVFPAAFFQQTVLAPDALERAMTDGQVELADQAARTERRKSFAELDKLRLRGGRSLLRLLVTSTGQDNELARAALLIMAPPLDDRGQGRGEQLCSGLDAAL